MKRLSASIVLSSLILAGCATPYQPVPFDRTATPVTKISVVENALPAEVGTQKLATTGENMASAAGASGGLIGALVVGVIAGAVEANIENNQRKKIQDALASQKFEGEAIFDAALEEALKGQNYQVETIAIARANTRDMIVLTPKADAEAGAAVLDAFGLNYGYQLVGGSTQWRPFVTMKVRLLDHKDPKKILMDNQITYNPVVKNEVTVSIPVDETYAFQKIEDLEADPGRAAEGLRVALQAAAKATADLLR